MNTDTVSNPAEGPSHDIAAAVLTHRLRRRVVVALSNRTAPVALADLATALADGDRAVSPAQRYDDLRTELHHVHLPRLAAADVIDYDPATTNVTATRTARLGAILSDGY